MSCRTLLFSRQRMPRNNRAFPNAATHHAPPVRAHLLPQPHHARPCTHHAPPVRAHLLPQPSRPPPRERAQVPCPHDVARRALHRISTCDGHEAGQVAGARARDAPQQRHRARRCRAAAESHEVATHVALDVDRSFVPVAPAPPQPRPLAARQVALCMQEPMHARTRTLLQCFAHTAPQMHRGGAGVGGCGAAAEPPPSRIHVLLLGQRPAKHDVRIYVCLRLVSGTRAVNSHGTVP
eukprot:311997-Chlamydomonas_euryale.AAC.1